MEQSFSFRALFAFFAFLVFAVVYVGLMIAVPAVLGGCLAPPKFTEVLQDLITGEHFMSWWMDATVWAFPAIGAVARQPVSSGYLPCVWDYSLGTFLFSATSGPLVLAAISIPSAVIGKLAELVVRRMLR